MLYEDIKNWDRQLTEDDFYEALNHMLADAYPHLSEEELEDLLDDYLDQLPAGQAEALMDSVANVAKQVGGGALDFIRNNPGLVKGIASGVGMLGGPAVSMLAGKAAGMATNALAGKPNPSVGKVTALVNNPQVQTALVRGTLGLDTAPHGNKQNGQVSQMPLAIYLRAIIASAQAALVELEQRGGASAGLSEAWGEDVDGQAEWLAEDLGGELEEDIQDFDLNIFLPFGLKYKKTHISYKNNNIVVNKDDKTHKKNYKEHIEMIEYILACTNGIEIMYKLYLEEKDVYFKMKSYNAEINAFGKNILPKASRIKISENELYIYIGNEKISEIWYNFITDETVPDDLRFIKDIDLRVFFFILEVNKSSYIRKKIDVSPKEGEIRVETYIDYINKLPFSSLLIGDTCYLFNQFVIQLYSMYTNMPKDKIKKFNIIKSIQK